MRIAILVPSVLYLALSCADAVPAEVKVLAVLPAREVLHDLAPVFEQQTGDRLVTTFLGSVDLRKRVEDGVDADLVLTVDKDIDAFVVRGRVLPGSKVELMRSSIGFAVQKGRPKPVVNNSEDLKETLHAVSSIGYSTGSSGVYLEALFQKLGILDQIRPKLHRVPSSATVGQALAAGEVEIAFQQVSELIDDPAIDFAGPLPPGLQQTTVYSAGVGSVASLPESARALSALLASPATAKVKIAHGMEPIAP